MSDELEFNDPFHDVGRLFPSDTKVETLKPTDTVHDALARMIEARFSQMPVVENGKLRGIFSLWSFARFARETQIDFADVPIEEVMDEIHTIRNIRFAL